ncbi:hypothetical protein ACWGB8_24200 [Kitasatospora sp. NPDC054939]
MPGTPPAPLGAAAGTRWLAALVLVPALAACSGGGGGGGGGSGNGSASSAARSASEPGATPPAEGGQPQEQRTKAGGNQGGFSSAGQVTATASGTWRSVRVELSSTNKVSFRATVSDVRDCTPGSGSPQASPASQPVEVVNGRSLAAAEFTFTSPEPNVDGKRKICATVRIGNESRTLTAEGGVSVSGGGAGDPDPGGSSPTSQKPGNSPKPGNQSPSTRPGGSPNPGGGSSAEPAPLPAPAGPR